MPIIKSKPMEEEKIQLRVGLKSSICQEISQYCQWAGIKYKDYFIEEACKHIFQNDKKWQKYQMGLLRENEPFDKE